MKWNMECRFEMPSSRSVITPIDLIYAFDGPQIFTAKFGFIEAIFVKIDDLDDSFLWLVASTDEQTVSLLRESKVSVRAAFLLPHSWVVQTNNEMEVEKYWSCKFEDISEDMLPACGVALDGKRPVPDNIEQAQAFFAINFQGKQLARSAIKFNLFKSLIDDTYDATRRILGPTYLWSSKSATFDFLIQRPIFGSLIIVIEEPIINRAAIVKNIKFEDDISFDQIDEQFINQRNTFFIDMADVILKAEQGPLNSTTIEERFTLLENIHNLIPSEENKIESVTFSAKQGFQSDLLVVNEKVGAILHRAFKEGLSTNREETGKIDIINSDKFTFVMRSVSSNRQITCRLDPASFKELTRDNRFRNGVLIKVHGAFERRATRDKLAVDRIPQILD